MFVANGWRAVAQKRFSGYLCIRKKERHDYYPFYEWNVDHAFYGRLSRGISAISDDRIIVRKWRMIFMYTALPGMEFTMNFCAELAGQVPTYDLGFSPDEAVLS